MLKVGLIMGSDSDWPVMEPAWDQLRELGLEAEAIVASAHRTPGAVREFAEGAQGRGLGVIIAAAGAAAHLAGVVASFTALPVIGVPISGGPFKGADALLSMVQMPPGVPVATMAVDGAKNAALFAAAILALGDKTLAGRLAAFRQRQAEGVARKNAKLQEKIKAREI